MTDVSVAHVINRYGWSGGAENQLSMNLMRLATAGIEHTVIAMYKDDDPLSSLRGYGNVEVRYLSHEDEAISRVGLYRLLHSKLDELAPALVHSSLADAALGSRLYAMRRGTKVLESLVNISHEDIRTVDNPHVNGMKLSAYRLLDRFTMKPVTHFHAISRAVANSWINTVGLDPKDITIIPRGVDTSVFYPGDRESAAREVKADLGLNNASRLVVNVGRQEPQKGQKYLLQAFSSVLEAIPDAVLLIAGRPGNSTQSLRALANQLQLGDRVRFIGVREDVPHLLRAADCFVFPSLFEGMGVSLLEAMACGTPVVVSGAASFAEMVADGESALMVDVRESEALTNAIVRILQNPGFANSLGMAARAVIQDRYRIEDTAKDMHDLYHSLIEK